MPNQSPHVHSLCIEDRSRMTISGVEDVECFSDDMAVIATTQGAVTITGANIKVERLDLESGAVSLDGQIDAIEYGTVRKNGFFARIFR